MKFLPKLGKSLVAIKRVRGAGYDPSQHVQKIMEKGCYNTFPPYVEFANLDYDDDQQLLEYANQKGIPTNRNQIFEKDLGGEIGHYLKKSELDLTFLYKQCRGISEEKLKKEKLYDKIYPMDWFRKEIQEMKFVLDLKTIADNPKGLVHVVRIGDGKARRYTSLGVKDALRLILNKKISEIKITLVDFCSSDKKGKEPLFLMMYKSKDLLQALYANLLEDISLKTSKCADPKCGKYFTVTHTGKIYCESYCGVKVARRRNYQKKKEEANNGKHL